MNASYEVVYTVIDYYDEPRSGIANYHGQPHIYQAQCETSMSRHPTTFLLSPINDTTFQLALEDWDIWLRWKAAFQAGITTIDTHPALPEDRARHSVIQQMLEQKYQSASQGCIVVRGKFRPCEAASYTGKTYPFEVYWEAIRE